MLSAPIHFLFPYRATAIRTTSSKTPPPQQMISQPLILFDISRFPFLFSWYVSLALNHVAQVRCSRRIGEQSFLDVAAANAALNRQREKVDLLLRMRTDQMRAENAFGLIFDQHFEGRVFRTK